MQFPDVSRSIGGRYGANGNGTESRELLGNDVSGGGAVSEG